MQLAVLIGTQRSATCWRGSAGSHATGSFHAALGPCAIEGCGQLHEIGGRIHPPAASLNSLAVSWRSVSFFNASLRGWACVDWSMFIGLPPGKI
jgi:hypothetical protein